MLAVISAEDEDLSCDQVVVCDVGVVLEDVVPVGLVPVSHDPVDLEVHVLCVFAVVELHQRAGEESHALGHDAHVGSGDGGRKLALRV